MDGDGTHEKRDEKREYGIEGGSSRTCRKPTSALKENERLGMKRMQEAKVHWGRVGNVARAMLAAMEKRGCLHALPATECNASVPARSMSGI